MVDAEHELYDHMRERFRVKYATLSEQAIDYLTEVSLSYLSDLMIGKIDIENPPTVEEYLRIHEARKKREQK